MSCRNIILGSPPMLKGGIAMLAAGGARHARSLGLLDVVIWHSTSPGSESRYLTFVLPEQGRVKIRISGHHITNASADLNVVSRDGRSGLDIINTYITERACNLTKDELAIANASRRVNDARRSGKSLTPDVLADIAKASGCDVEWVRNLAGVVR